MPRKPAAGTPSTGQRHISWQQHAGQGLYGTTRPEPKCNPRACSEPFYNGTAAVSTWPLHRAANLATMHERACNASAHAHPVDIPGSSGMRARNAHAQGALSAALRLCHHLRGARPGTAAAAGGIGGARGTGRPGMRPTAAAAAAAAVRTQGSKKNQIHQTQSGSQGGVLFK